MTKAQREPRKFKRWLRTRLLPRCSKLCAFVGLVILGLWITGRVLTDQYQWSQYLWWVPAIWMLGSAWICLGLSAALALFSRRLGGMFLRPLLLIVCIGCTGYLIIGVWHMHRIVLPTHKADETVRIVHWNQSAKRVDQQAWADAMLEDGVDIVFVSNAPWGKDRQDLLDAFAPFAPLEKERWVNYSYRVHGEPAHFRIEGNAFIASKFPMTRTGMVSIHTPTPEETLRPGGQRGWVMFAEFELAQGDSKAKPFVVWFVDMPSEPMLWRQELMAKARHAVDNWNGQSWVMGRHVWELIETNGSFPEPDLIIGDFNTVRGSDSLDHLAPDMTDAFSAVGYGRGGSWMPRVSNRFVRQPIKLADWHIDLALVGEGWTPTRYRIEDVSEWGSTEHRMQFLDLAPKTIK